MDASSIHMRNLSYELLGELPEVPFVSISWADGELTREARGFLTPHPDGRYDFDHVSGDSLYWLCTQQREGGE